MKIIELTASNVKRLKAVDITPDGTLQVIGGKNAQGKSSVLDAIWLALGGGKASKETPLPIRDGEEKASVRLDLGDLIITRSWTQKGTTLKVENPDGATFKSPQGMLDDLVGRLSFDPLAFTRLSPKEQREALLGLVDVGIDLDKHAAERQSIYDQRAEVGRQGKAIGDVVVDNSLPTEETSAGEIIEQIQAAQAANLRIEKAESALANIKSDIEANKREIERLQQLVRIDEADAKELAETLNKSERVDESSLRESLASVEESNAAIRANNAAREQAERKAELAEQWKALSHQIDALDAEKAEALKAAKFPVKGLGFDEQGVTYKGVPLSQASSAEQIRVSLAMGMALNPKLRVLMIKDGSLLDEDSMSAIREQVAAGDFQLWIERVGNADQGAVIIEDGQVQA